MEKWLKTIPTRHGIYIIYPTCMYETRHYKIYIIW